jgi:hypothetical protein
MYVGLINILFLLPTVDEMYLASLIHKGKAVFTKGMTDPTAVPAECVITMATIAGAKAVLQENDIGSLEVGKKVNERTSLLCFRLCCSHSNA